MKLSEAIALYIELRDQKSVLKKQYDEGKAKLDSKMALIEAKVMEVMDRAGTNSVNTEAGTAYRTTDISATVADRDTFLNFCRENEEWSLMDVRASKAGIEQYKSANADQLPPGINWREERVVNFRRPS